MIISLVPLTSADHQESLQQVYRATPGYWALYDLAGSPAGQAARDLEAAAQTPGRTLMGIVRRMQDSQNMRPDDEQLPADGRANAVEMIGMLDFRLHWPAKELCYLGMLMVAEPFQRQGVGRQAWRLLEPWLAGSAKVVKSRLGVEQFNPGAMQFFQKQGFALTGESNRIEVGAKWVRILYMEKMLSKQEDAREEKTSV